MTKKDLSGEFEFGFVVVGGIEDQGGVELFTGFAGKAFDDGGAAFAGQSGDLGGGKGFFGNYGVEGEVAAFTEAGAAIKVLTGAFGE